MYVTRFELAAFWSVARRSIQLSYTYLDVNTSMPATGIEPVWEYKSRRILSPVRLPVPPHRLFCILIHNIYLAQPKYCFTASKSVLCRMGGEGFEPSKAVPADLQSVPFGHSGIHPYKIKLTIIPISATSRYIVNKEPTVGVEPTTC